MPRLLAEAAITTTSTMSDFFSTMEIEVLETIILAINSPPTLAAFASTCHTLRSTIEESCPLWRQLTVALLGEPLVALHRTAWGAVENADVSFYRRLFRVAYTGSEVCHANTLRQEIAADYNNSELAGLICATGHSANVCGHLVCVIGGWRPKCPVDHLHVCEPRETTRAVHVLTAPPPPTTTTTTTTTTTNPCSFLPLLVAPSEPEMPTEA